MSLSISSLPTVQLDYTNRGPALHSGMLQLRAMLDDDDGRTGYLVARVSVEGAVVPAVMARSDLYVLGFECCGNWFRFDDADWPFAEAASALGYEGRYGNLGGLAGDLTLGGIQGIARLSDITCKPHWKEPLRTLLVVVSECARLIPVDMQVLGLLNGIVSRVPLAPMAHYIQNWGTASKGVDLSRPVSATQRVGFRDPTIVKR